MAKKKKAPRLSRLNEPEPHKRTEIGDAIREIIKQEIEENLRISVHIRCGGDAVVSLSYKGEQISCDASSLIDRRSDYMP